MPHHEAKSEIYTAAMFGQLLNAAVPMYVTLLGMVTEVMLLQLAKAHCPMEVTPDGITKSFTSLPFKYRCLSLYKSQHIGFDELLKNAMLHHAAKSEICTDEMLPHPLKASSPMALMLLGMVMEVRPKQL